MPPSRPIPPGRCPTRPEGPPGAADRDPPDPGGARTGVRGRGPGEPEGRPAHHAGVQDCPRDAGADHPDPPARVARLQTRLRTLPHARIPVGERQPPETVVQLAPEAKLFTDSLKSRPTGRRPPSSSSSPRPMPGPRKKGAASISSWPTVSCRWPIRERRNAW